MARYNRLKRAEAKLVVNRITIDGPPKELQRFKGATLLQNVAEQHVILDAGHATGWKALDDECPLVLEQGTETCLVFENRSAVMPSVYFISQMAQRWPKLKFTLESRAVMERGPASKRQAKRYSVMRAALKTNLPTAKEAPACRLR
jgi:hypothetical protein